MAGGREELARDIFGGSDSELSSEDERPVQRRRTVAQADDYGSSGDSDDYGRRKAPKAKGKRKSRVAREGEVPKRKRKRRPSPEQRPLGADDERKQKIDDTINNILRPNKRSKKRKKDNEDEVDRFADEEVQHLRDAMLKAVQEDRDANASKLPATAKLKMLPEVMEVLQKASLAQSVIDNNLLSAVKLWLEPLPDKSLPALNIQHAFFEALSKMYIDTSSLKESQLGKIVLFYTQCSRVTTSIRRIAKQLVETWSRPIIKRSASYRDRQIPVAAETDPDAPRKQETLNTILARGRAADQSRKRRNAVQIPERSLGTYTVAPRSAPVGGETERAVLADVERRRKNKDMLRKMTKRLDQKKAGR